MKNSNFYVYIITNPGKTVLYTGVTNDLTRRLSEHYQNRGNKETFAGKYYCHRLLYYESHISIDMAITREKEIKNLTREKKIELIKTMNTGMGFIEVKF